MTLYSAKYHSLYSLQKKASKNGVLYFCTKATTLAGQPVMTYLWRRKRRIKNKQTNMNQLIIHPELKKRKISWKQGVKKNSWLLDVSNRRLTAVPKKKRSRWCKKKSRQNLELAALLRSLKTAKQFFSQVLFVCCLYTTTSFFSTSLNMSDALLMPCDRKKQQKYDEFSFSLNLEKKCCQNTNKTKTLH